MFIILFMVEAARPNTPLSPFLALSIVLMVGAGLGLVTCNAIGCADRISASALAIINISYGGTIALTGLALSVTPSRSPNALSKCERVALACYFLLGSSYFMIPGICTLSGKLSSVTTLGWIGLAPFIAPLIILPPYFIYCAPQKPEEGG